MAKNNNLSNPIFHDADKARTWLEAQLWKEGPVCPHCGVVGEATLMDGKSHHVRSVTGNTLRPILEAQVHGKTFVMTDEGATAKSLGKSFSNHGMVNHSIGEYVRGNIHTNTIEGYFSILKRGVVGTYHHVSQQHLKRYLAEFDFRYNEREALGVNDAQRMEKSILGIVGKRLTYQRTDREGAQVRT
jgi:ISXO2-like transposase domain/Transposase zinc-ribbon domain